jgi:hypothetical protein
MNASTITPSIEVSIGREPRLCHGYITTAPTSLNAPIRTLRTARARSGAHGTRAAGAQPGESRLAVMERQ